MLHSSVKPIKMKVMLFMFFGVYPIDDQTNHHLYLELVYKILGWLAVLTCRSVLVSYVLSTIDYGLSDMNNALYAAFPGISPFGAMVAHILMIFYPEKITLFFVKLQTFYDQSILTSIKTLFGLLKLYIFFCRWIGQL